MIRSNDIHSPRFFEYTSPILIGWLSETMGAISSPKYSHIIIKKKKVKTYEFEMFVFVINKFA